MIRRSLQRFIGRRRPAPVRDGRRTFKDRELARRLFRTFEYDLELTGVRGIHFYVQNGTVTLYGAVRHELDRELLVSLTRQIAGVKSVVEQLQVVDQSFQDADAELTLTL